MTEAAPSKNAEESLPRWTGDMIAGFDWKRIVELARALSLAHGFRLGKTRVHPDGSVEFVISLGDNPVIQHTLVRLTRWNQWMAATDCLARFAVDMLQFKGHHGIFIAPGGFAPAALQLAQGARIEAVDAEIMARRLNELPAEHREFYFNIATAGDATTPSCPSCLQPLKLVQDSFGGSAGFLHLPDMRYDSSDIVGDAVAARRIEIMPHCEVQFLKEVRTRDLVVHGKITGDFICEGGVVLHPGAMLHGSVAARSVDVRPGADLLGETRILEGKLESFGRTIPALLWRCANGRSQPGCGAVSFLPH